MNALKQFTANGEALLKSCRNERESVIVLKALKNAAIQAQDFEAAAEFIREEKTVLTRMPAELSFAYFADIPGVTYEAHFNVPRKHVVALHASLCSFGDDCSDWCKTLRQSILNHLKASRKKFVSIEITLAPIKRERDKLEGAS